MGNFPRRIKAEMKANQEKFIRNLKKETFKNNLKNLLPILNQERIELFKDIRALKEIFELTTN